MSNRKFILLLCLLASIFVAVEGCSDQGSSAETSSMPSLETVIREDGNYMLLYGDLVAEIPANTFLSTFDYGDVVTVVVAEKDTFDAPVVSKWNEVSSGEYLVLVEPDSSYIDLSISCGQIAVELGIAKTTDGENNALFELREDLQLPIKVEITLKEKGGYAANLKMREKQNQGKKRENYPDLSDAEYANFRAISTPGMGKNILYRSSSPIDPSLGRNTFADSLAKEAQISVFINLTDNEKGLSSREGFDGSYYSEQKIIALGLPAAYASSTFKDGLLKGFRFMIDNEGPYLIHCREGKDRAGYVSAILEALMGANIEDIKKDYVKTYTNYYNVVDDKQVHLFEEDIAWFEMIIVRNLKYVLNAEGFEIEDLEKVDDLSNLVTKYLLNIGLDESEIKALKARLTWNP